MEFSQPIYIILIYKGILIFFFFEVILGRKDGLLISSFNYRWTQGSRIGNVLVCWIQWPTGDFYESYFQVHMTTTVQSKVDWSTCTSTQAYI
jgi:hypothetical protein